MSLAETASHGCTITINGSSLEGIFNGPNGPGFRPNVVEARHHSTEATIRKVSYVDTTPCSFSIYYDSTQSAHGALRDAAANGTAVSVVQTLTDTGGEVYTYSALVDFAAAAPVDGYNTADVTLSVDGDITIT